MIQEDSVPQVNNLSMLAKLTMPLQAAYCASKHALLALQNSAALEAAATSVRVNSVSPGFCRCRGQLVSASFGPSVVVNGGSDERSELGVCTCPI